MTGTSAVRGGIRPATDCRWLRQRAASTWRVRLTGEPSSSSRSPSSRSPSSHVRLERLEQQPVERQVPLAEVLHRGAARTELELDEPEQRVVLVEGVADAAQVVDGG